MSSCAHSSDDIPYLLNELDRISGNRRRQSCATKMERFKQTYIIGAFEKGDKEDVIEYVDDV